MGTNARTLGPVLLALAAELRAESARQKFGPRELSRASGVPYSTVRKSLAGERMVDVEELTKMCAALGISASDMLERAELSGASGTSSDLIAAHEDGSIGGEQVDRNET